jgi:flagellar motor switch/type III secretory pathway protein FliN
VSKPFPYEWLPRWTHGEVTRANAIARALQPVRRSAATRTLLDARWQPVLGAVPEAWPGVPSVLTPEAFEAQFSGTTVCAVMRHATLGVMAVCLESPFALALASRALGSSDVEARRIAAGRTLGAAHEGALAMLCAQAAVIACAPSPPPVVRGVTDRTSDVIAALGATSLAVWPWRVAVGVDAGHASLVVDARALTAAETLRERLDVTAFADAWITVELRLARAALPAHEIATLAVGDVVATDHAAAVVENGCDEGAVSIALGAVEFPTRWMPSGVSLSGEARIATSVDATRRGKMSGENGSDAGNRTDVLGVLPVDVDVVIARTAATLADIASWRSGEVVAFPVRIGELVEVRAGGRIVARGELCDVEGQLGVRVTELL